MDRPEWGLTERKVRVSLVYLLEHHLIENSSRLERKDLIALSNRC